MVEIPLTWKRVPAKEMFRFTDRTVRSSKVTCKDRLRTFIAVSSNWEENYTGE